MNPNGTRTLPTLGLVAREQVAFVVASAWRSWPVLLLVGLLLAWAASSSGFPAYGFAVFLTLLSASIITGAAWPMRPGPNGRTYFSSLPGSRPRNIAIRTAGAWVVLMLTAIFLSAITHRLGTPEPQPFWSHVPPLVGATAVLLAMSGPMAKSNHAPIWISGIVWVPLILSKLGGTAASEALLSILEGRLGVVTLVSGQALVSGRILGPEADISPAQFIFDLPSWLAACAIWLTASVAIFVFAITRRTEV